VSEHRVLLHQPQAARVHSEVLQGRLVLLGRDVLPLDQLENGAVHYIAAHDVGERLVLPARGDVREPLAAEHQRADRDHLGRVEDGHLRGDAQRELLLPRTVAAPALLLRLGDLRRLDVARRAREGLDVALALLHPVLVLTELALGLHLLDGVGDRVVLDLVDLLVPPQADVDLADLEQLALHLAQLRVQVDVAGPLVPDALLVGVEELEAALLEHQALHDVAEAGEDVVVLNRPGSHAHLGQDVLRALPPVAVEDVDRALLRDAG